MHCEHLHALSNVSVRAGLGKGVAEMSIMIPLLVVFGSNETYLPLSRKIKTI